MSKLLQAFLAGASPWHRKNIVIWAITLSSLSLLSSLFFSGSMQVERAVWYRVFSYVTEDIALIGSSLLCFRNGLSKRMPSGREVWLLIGVALGFYLIGNLFFSLCELLWYVDPVGSLSDIFFVLFYILLMLGMGIAIANKQIKLRIYQWSIIAGITTYVAVMAMWIATPPPTSTQAAPLTVISTVKSSPSQVFLVDQLAKIPDPNPPAWVKSVNAVVKPHEQLLNQFYLLADVVLFGLAIAMILAFWGRRLSNAWQVNAQAIICFYIADMWIAYAANHLSGYQSGFIIEIFWMFGIVQFGVAAGLEFEHMAAHQKLKVKS